MDIQNRPHSVYENLVERWGGSYLIWISLFSLAISHLTAIVGVYYSITAAGLRDSQITQYILILILFTILYIIPVLIFSIFSTVTARSRLDSIVKGKPALKNLTIELIESRAWHEIQSLPSRLLTAESISLCFIAILPVILIMRFLVGINATQVLHLSIGGIVGGIIVLVINRLVLEWLLIPAHRKLIVPSVNSITPSFGYGIRARLIGIIALLILATIIFLAGLGIQKSIEASLPGGDLALAISSFQQSALILAGMLFILGLIFGSVLSKLIVTPIEQINETLGRVAVGDSSARADILTLDELSHLALQLNQVLGELQGSQINLEKQVDDRTTELKQRTLQLQAAARVSQDTSAARDLPTLLTTTVNLISDHFGFYHAGIYLIDAAGEYVSLQAASSEGGKIMIARGHKVEVNQSSIIGIAAYENRMHLTVDPQNDPLFHVNPDLPKTLSQAAIPLTPRGKFIGILDIQSNNLSAFSAGDLELLQTLADQVALAIMNVQLIEENQFTLSRMEAALSENVRRAWGEGGLGQKRRYHYTPTGLSLVTTDTKIEKQTDASRFSVPITLRGQNLGNLELVRKGGNVWNESDHTLAADVASQIGLALDNSRLLQDTQQRVMFEQMLSDLTSKLSRSVDTDLILQTTVQELHHIPDVTEVSVILTPPETSSEKE